MDSRVIIEIIGIVAMAFVLVGMCFKTMTFWGSFWFRLLNLIGSAIFLVYGILLPALSTAILNGFMIIVNIVYVIVMFYNRKKQSTKAVEETK